MKILVILLAFFVSSPSYAKEDICNEFIKLEKKLSANLPKQVDEITELVEFKVNCSTKTVQYSKRILVNINLFKDDWKNRKQRQHTNMHCNKQGLASSLKWNATDVLFDKDYNYLVTFITQPNDCK